ncbi:MAG: IS1634 family transposase [Planctomycetes bacterium]|nr:IS1634 family transposase [Planctomycetota bacterium]
MYIATVPNRTSPPAILLREGYREGGKVKTRTLANLSKLPAEAIEAIKRVLKGEQLVSTEELFEIVAEGSPAHGHVEAVLTAMRRLGLAGVLSSRPSRQRDLVLAMVAARLLEPQSKIATTRWWPNTTLAETLGVGDADEDELYAAMDWLLARQDAIEKKLAARHLDDGGVALYDLTSSYFEGETCPLAALGHSRDGKKGKLQVNYGLLANARGIPVAVSVFAGNTGDPKTLLPQVDKVRDSFGIGRFVLVGDRGMITQTQIEALRQRANIDWLTALRPAAIRQLLEDGSIQMGLFDERNLFELEHADWPGERLIACRNPELAVRRAAKREALLEATTIALDKVRQMVGRGRLHGQQDIGERVEKVLKQYRIGQHYRVDIRDDGLDWHVDEEALAAALAAQDDGDAARAAQRRQRAQRHVKAIRAKLDKIRQRVEHGRLHGQDQIGVRVGRVIDRYKMAKHFMLHIDDDAFDFERDQDHIDAEAALDGIYVIRTSVDAQTMDADQAVRGYKQLSVVERAFRCLKSVELMVRPIRHRLEDRVRAHIFLCVLAYYVQWHMNEAWRPLLFADPDQHAKTRRDPVAPAQRSEAAMRKVHGKRLDDASPVHSFQTLLKNLAAIVRNTCRCPQAGPEAPTFHKTTTPNAKQQQALDLLQTISV